MYVLYVFIHIKENKGNIQFPDPKGTKQGTFFAQSWRRQLKNDLVSSCQLRLLFANG
jgi:hypothetical protein